MCEVRIWKPTEGGECEFYVTCGGVTDGPYVGIGRAGSRARQILDGQGAKAAALKAAILDNLFSRDELLIPGGWWLTIEIDKGARIRFGSRDADNRPKRRKFDSAQQVFDMLSSLAAASPSGPGIS